MTYSEQRGANNPSRKGLDRVREVYHIERLTDKGYVYEGNCVGSPEEAENELKYLRGLGYVRGQSEEYRVVQAWVLDDSHIYANDWM